MRVLATAAALGLLAACGSAPRYHPSERQLPESQSSPRDHRSKEGWTTLGNNVWYICHNNRVVYADGSGHAMAVVSAHMGEC